MAGSTRYAVLLRGINLAGHNRIPMAGLRTMLERLGYDDVATHLQSGNAVVSTGAGADAVARRVEAAVTKEFGYDVDIVVRTHRELLSVVKRNPYPPGLEDPAKLLVSFLGSKPAAATVKGLDPARFAPDQFWVDGREVYLWCPNGVGKSKLPKDFFAKLLSTPATARNWNTVTKLVELTAT